jgi:hypothetical protein
MAFGDPVFEAALTVAFTLLVGREKSYCAEYVLSTITFLSSYKES